MRIEELHLKNFRCFKELDIKFPASNLAVFIGLNGSGKTAILDIIALYLDMKLIITETPKSSGFSRQCNLDDISIGSEYTENKILINYGNKINLWEDTYFKDKTKNNYRTIKNLYFRAVNDDRYICLYYLTNRKEIYAIYEMRAEYTNFDDFDKWFEEAENFENALKLERKSFEVTYVKLDVVRKAIETFFSSISGVQFSELKIKRIIINKEIFGSYKDEIEQHSSSLVIQYNGEELKLSQLSEGQRLLLHLVGDIAFRLTNDDKNLDAIDFDDHSNAVNAALQSKGIILIDEIELHLHPQWQREVLPALQKTFPNIQFIVTTHSPQVLSNVKKKISLF